MKSVEIHAKEAVFKQEQSISQLLQQYERSERLPERVEEAEERISKVLSEERRSLGA